MYIKREKEKSFHNDIISKSCFIFCETYAQSCQINILEGESDVHGGNKKQKHIHTKGVRNAFGKTTEDQLFKCII